MRNALAILVIALLAVSCTPKKGAMKGAGADGAMGAGAEGDGPRLAYAKGEDMPEGDIREGSYQPVAELATVHFEYDQYGLSVEATEALRGNTAWLKQHPELSVLVEGHADEKGTSEYNLALGQKRAKTVREYYIRAGVAPGQVGTISYGKERPECTGDYEACGPKNRRAVTLVAAKKQ